jgi:hypothetical protein
MKRSRVHHGVSRAAIAGKPSVACFSHRRRIQAGRASLAHPPSRRMAGGVWAPQCIYCTKQRLKMEIVRRGKHGSLESPFPDCPITRMSLRCAYFSCMVLALFCGITREVLWCFRHVAPFLPPYDACIVLLHAVRMTWRSFLCMIRKGSGHEHLYWQLGVEQHRT